ncbi:MAG: hypothetical protein ACKV2U_12915 [Bryobacteraceae bacterium]
MSTRINITFGSETVGTIDFTQPEGELGSVRTANGFRLHIPAVVTFLPTGTDLPLILENLRATFFQDGAGKEIEIGVASYSATLFTPVRETQISLSLDGTLDAFAFHERIRAGQEAKFRLSVSGDIRYVLIAPGGSATGRDPVSIAKTFHQRGVVYSRMIWTKMMRDLNLRDSVPVEIPFSAHPPTGWEPVWDALRDARSSFDTGGSTGWKNTVTSVRFALEEWRKLEKEDQGPGRQSPKTSDLQSPTKEQRIDNIRWHLIQVAHCAAHTRADEWTRDDALLLLSTLCSLLAVRKP